mgnify:CR=1 FL=1
MKIRAYIMFLLCLFQVAIYAQKTAQVTLTIRLHPIQTIEVESADVQMLEISNQDDATYSDNKRPPSQHVKTFSTSRQVTYVEKVKREGFEALRAVRERPPHEDKSINHIFSNESYYYKDGDEFDDDLNVVYTMVTL